jgi:hypothetical protein
MLSTPEHGSGEKGSATASHGDLLFGGISRGATRCTADPPPATPRTWWVATQKGARARASFFARKSTLSTIVTGARTMGSWLKSYGNRTPRPWRRIWGETAGPGRLGWGSPQSHPPTALASKKHAFSEVLAAGPVPSHQAPGPTSRGYLTSSSDSVPGSLKRQPYAATISLRIA